MAYKAQKRCLGYFCFRKNIASNYLAVHFVCFVNVQHSVRQLSSKSSKDHSVAKKGKELCDDPSYYSQDNCTCLSLFELSLPIYVSVSVSLYIFKSVFLSVFVSVPLSVFVWLHLCLCLCLRMCLSTCLCLYICLCLCVCLYLCLRLYVYVSALARLLVCFFVWA